MPLQPLGLQASCDTTVHERAPERAANQQRYGGTHKLATAWQRSG